MSLTIKIIQCVERTKLFEDCEIAWDAWNDSEPKCNWGQNDHSLIHASYIHSTLNLWIKDHDNNKFRDVANQMQIVLNRIIDNGYDQETGSGDFLVDLEH